MTEKIFQFLSFLVIITILFGIYIGSFKYHKPTLKTEWHLRGDEIMYDSSNYQLKAK